MNIVEFRALLTKTYNSLVDLTGTKGQEYAGSRDQLANFKRLSEQLKMRPEAVLWVYLTKHLDSLSSYIRGLNRPTKPTLSEPIEGRIDDAILYLCLLKALVAEREGGNSTPCPTFEKSEPDVDWPTRASTIRNWQERVARWADGVYPNRTPHTSLAKLSLEEIPEFLMSKAKEPHEFADIIILVLDIAHQHGIDVEQAIDEKMTINENRRWRVDPKTGVMSHVEEKRSIQNPSCGHSHD